MNRNAILLAAGVSRQIYLFTNRGIPYNDNRTNFTLPKEATHLQRWWTTLRDRPSIQAIENPVSFYLERYARFAAQSVAAGGAHK